MNDREERAFMIRQCRNSILSTLGIIYPSALDGTAILLALINLYPNYDGEICVKDLVYLEEKGYIERRHPLTGKASQGTHWKKARWRLTARGNEVANDLVDDPALEV